jgi:hypothetical protein
MSTEYRPCDFTGLKSITLPVVLAPREGKHYGTEILDATGALVVTIWTASGEPSTREKERFRDGWTPEKWEEWCCDCHWESQQDLNMAEWLVRVLNAAQEAPYRKHPQHPGLPHPICGRNHFNLDEMDEAA